MRHSKGIALAAALAAATGLAIMSPASPTTTTTTDHSVRGAPFLPDIGIRTLRLFEIETSHGHKMLKFPGVTANVGFGPLQVRANRRTSTSTRWHARQLILHADGSWTKRPVPRMDFYFAGDGHRHWHMEDFDSYELYDESGTVLAEGEKHGFCFNDNTNYRDWPSEGTNGAPRHPVYKRKDVCGIRQPKATSILHALSVGWSDTYPATLPDQGIDITGLDDGIYTVKVTADVRHLIRELNEHNNSATAAIEITGNTVTLLSATDGL